MAFHSAGMDGIEALGIDGGEESEKLGMNIDVDPFGRSAKSADVAGMQFRPTIMVGLGGTGVECVRRAKKKILERVGPLPTTAYVYIDADEKSFMNDSTGELAPVEQSEQCFIGGTNLQPLLNHPEAHAWLLNQLPGKLASGHYEKAAKGDGCGQIRAVRTDRAAHLDAEREGNIEQCHNQGGTACDPPANTITHCRQRCLTSSQPLCIHRLLDRGGDRVRNFYRHGPASAGSDREPGQDGRDFRVTRRIRRESSGRPVPARLHAGQCLCGADGTQTLRDMRDDLLPETVINAGGETVKLPRPPALRLAYLIDYKNEQPALFPYRGCLRTRCPPPCLHETASPFRVNADSVERNCNTLRAVDKCPETGLPRNFSSFANTGSVFPS